MQAGTRLQDTNPTLAFKEKHRPLQLFQHWQQRDSGMPAHSNEDTCHKHMYGYLFVTSLDSPRTVQGSSLNHRSNPLWLTKPVYVIQSGASHRFRCTQPSINKSQAAQAKSYTVVHSRPPSYQPVRNHHTTLHAQHRTLAQHNCFTPCAKGHTCTGSVRLSQQQEPLQSDQTDRPTGYAN